MATITEYLDIILEKNDLTFEQAKGLLDTIFEGEVADVQIAAFLAAMRIKQAMPEEIAGFAKSLREHAVAVKVDVDNLIDTCGTGGASVKTFNVSTAAALVAAGAGAYVAKHGNRSITSKCGSADVLEKLGVKINAEPEVVAKCIKEAHVGFMFAPKFHPAMKFVQPIRKSLDFRTAFNILGPLANPAGVKSQVMGVYGEHLLDSIIETHKLLGAKRAMVVHSDGMDEISISGLTKMRTLKEGEIKTKEFNPEDFGIKKVSLEELKGGDTYTNARIIKDILIRKEKGARKDIVVVNAAAGIIVANLVDDFESAIKMAEQSITDGKAIGCLEKLIAISNKG